MDFSSQGYRLVVRQILSACKKTVKSAFGLPDPYLPLPGVFSCQSQRLLLKGIHILPSLREKTGRELSFKIKKAVVKRTDSC